MPDRKKIKIVTLGGQTQEHEVDPNSTLADLLGKEAARVNITDENGTDIDLNRPIKDIPTTKFVKSVNPKAGI